MQKLLDNYLKFLSGQYTRESMKSEILEFKSNNGDAQEFEKLIIKATKGGYKKNIAIEDFRRYYGEYTPNIKSRASYGTGHMKDFRKNF